MKLKNILSASLLIIVLSVPMLLGAEELPNPVGETSVIVIVGNIIRAMLGMLGAATLIMFVYGGFMMVFSAGNEERLKKGRGTLVWAIIGMAIALSSYSILSYLFKILSTATN